MITALCLNPSLDRTLNIGRLIPGKTHRLVSFSDAAGGKGLNVARSLSLLKSEAQVLMFLAEDAGALMHREAQAGGFRLRAAAIEGRLRVNLKIREQDGRVTELNAPGTPCGPQALESMEALALEVAGESSWLCLCGSLPPGCPEDYYAKLIRAARSRAPRLRVALDCSGESLRLALREGPDLVKPNLEELAGWMGRPVQNGAQIEEALRALRQAGAGDIILSMGAEGARLDTREGAWFAPGLKVPPVSTVGAGDAMLAGYIAARERGLIGAEAFRLACAAAAARVAGQAEDMEKYLKMTEVWPL